MNFRPMRRIKQQLKQEQCLAILKKATTGTLAVLGDDDYPYAVPLSYVFHDGTIYFHSALEGHKIDAIRRHNKASFCVIDKDDVHGEEYTTYFRSVIAFGHISIIENLDDKLATAQALGRKYNPGDEAGLKRELEKSFTHMLMLKFHIDHLTGKEAIELVAHKKHHSQ